MNYPDVLIIEDKYQFKPPRPFAPGGEFAGVVKRVGDDVASLQPGDRVFGLSGWGAMAERVAVSADRCVKVPEGKSLEEAAAFMMTYATSHYALVGRARLQAGETLLVLGAAGGVGLAAVELGKSMGARVIAGVSSEEKAQAARARGADECLVYPRGPFEKAERRALADAFKAAVGASGAQVVYDAVGGDYTEAAVRALSWGGRLLVIGFPAGIPSPPLNLALLKGADILGVFWGSFTMHEPERHAAYLGDLVGLWRDGTVNPLVSKVYPLDQGGDAIAALAGRSTIGKVVVRLNSAS